MSANGPNLKGFFLAILNIQYPSLLKVITKQIVTKRVLFRVRTEKVSINETHPLINVIIRLNVS